jgi:hypothetical protein
MIKNKDIYFCAFLYSMGFEISSTSRESGRVLFHVQISEADLAIARAKWMTREDFNVSARPYSDAIRHLKAMLYDAQTE